MPPIMGTLSNRSATEPVEQGDGACVVVLARESRVRGEGRQGTDRVVKTEESSMDLDDQADEAWLLQRATQTLSMEQDSSRRQLP